jgi:hypothetical protein
VDDFLAAIGTAVDGARIGDTVHGSDRGKIGTVDEVLPQGEAPGYFSVPRGAAGQGHLHLAGRGDPPG